MFNGEEFGQAVVDAVLKSVQPLRDKIIELEKQLANQQNVAGAHIDREGNLVLTYSNGAEKNLGIVTAKGEPGKDGKDGKDGFDLKAFDVQLSEDGRALNFFFEDDVQKAHSTLTLPTLIYQGVWSEGSYQKGDSVTYQGSLFVALSDTDAKPGTSDWQLAVKRGRDGKGA